VNHGFHRKSAFPLAIQRQRTAEEWLTWRAGETFLATRKASQPALPAPAPWIQLFDSGRFPSRCRGRCTAVIASHPRAHRCRKKAARTPEEVHFGLRGSIAALAIRSGAFLPSLGALCLVDPRASLTACRVAQPSNHLGIRRSPSAHRRQLRWNHHRALFQSGSAEFALWSLPQPSLQSASSC